MYSHIVELPIDLQEMMKNRLLELQTTLNEQDDDIRALFQVFQRELMSEEDTEEEFMDVLFPFLSPENNHNMQEMMAGSVGRFVRYIISADYYKLFEDFLQIEARSALFLSCKTVPVGGERPLLHINAIDMAIKDFFALDVSGMSDKAILWSGLIEEGEDSEVWFLPDTVNLIKKEWLTVKLASGNQQVIDFMAEELDLVAYDDVCCSVFITSIFKSANQRLLESVVNLFLHLEEDYGTPIDDIFERLIGITSESMLFLLESIQENHALKEIMAPILIRMLFPKEDLGIEDDMHDGLLCLAADCLRSPALRQQLLTNKDPHKIYVALWAIGFLDADEGWNVANELIKDGNDQSKKVVLTYYQNHYSQNALEVIKQRIEQNINV